MKFYSACIPTDLSSCFDYTIILEKFPNMPNEMQKAGWPDVCQAGPLFVYCNKESTLDAL